MVQTEASISDGSWALIVGGSHNALAHKLGPNKWMNEWIYFDYLGSKTKFNGILLKNFITTLYYINFYFTRKCWKTERVER